MSRRTSVTPTSPAARRAAAMVAKYPGKTTQQLAALIGWSAKHTIASLTGARQAGTIGLLRIGGSRWWPADMLAEQERILRAAQREQYLRTRRESNLRSKERKAERKANQAGSKDVSGWPVVTRADVCAPLPFVCQAPASVFHLGASL